ncbi:tRNA pseudouridine(55) synthase TruB [Mycoplasma putrefaciens]|uniref:tRNA pseudouridine synthase B n=1 Tax=Mycoplasma putrefaciens (strain ATCC 15718 / NCTC 10155 / C30 KS-1 / KS-1) TaxID=743965 RepID=A0A7U4E9E9_MYCPK|nr:tRNA pseudouridine(55) synthase TruB [Mycoplasma putrefaciens]AEM68839.1 tRNA pseudouridine synthase B [Mycoplasma putrefaciens KS1]
MKQNSGIFIVDKPKNISTNKLIQKIKQKLNIKKIGHCGTLDPLATGVVICLVNSATKISDYLLNDAKKYLVTLKLFAQTDTFDAEGEVIQTSQVFLISLEKLNLVINKYNNYTYKQTPPIYSAIKVNGKKLYQYALADQKVDLQPRTVTIYSTKLLNYDQQNHELTLDVYCSKGTYIRSLAVDIARDLNTISYVKNLRRTQSGKFVISNAKLVNELSWDDLISIADTIKTTNYPIVYYDDFLSVKQGKKIELKNIDSDTVFISDDQNNLIACYQRFEGDIFKSKRGGLDI